MTASDVHPDTDGFQAAAVESFHKGLKKLATDWGSVKVYTQGAEPNHRLKI